MLKIAICDDENIWISQISEQLQTWGEQRNAALQIFSFNNGDALIAAHSRYHMDLILLDIMMPLLNGMDTARELRVQSPRTALVFLTSSSEFALESYEVRAFWYLMKPLNTDQFFHVLDEWYKLYQDSEEIFPARTATGYQKIPVQEVAYLEAQNKAVLVRLSNGKTIEIKEPFHKCEPVFSLEKGFFKCHRSYIVSFPCIEKFTKGELLTKSGQRIPVSRDVFAAFKDAYFSFMFPENT